MSKQERLRYLHAVYQISTNLSYKERYEALLDKHRQHFNDKIHKVTYFLPWHRWFILQYENLLQEVNSYLLFTLIK